MLSRAAFYARPIACVGTTAEVVDRSDDSQSDGFAAVDALVALTVLSSTIILTLAATQVARRAANDALETRRASELMQFIVLSEPHKIGDRTGRASGFRWRLETAQSTIAVNGATPPICTRRADATSLRTGHHYRLTTSEVCVENLSAEPAS